MPKGKRTVALPEVEPARLGGGLAVDFLNTVTWRRDPRRRRETLPAYPHVLAWAAATGLLSTEDAETLAGWADERPDAAAAEHALIIDMREAAYELLTGDGDPRALQRHLSAAHAASGLRSRPGATWEWGPGPLALTGPRHLLVLEYARLLTSDAVARFHRCEDEHCGWVFLDTSRRRNRRWCSAADCGNRNRVRAHYEREKNGTAEKR